MLGIEAFPARPFLQVSHTDMCLSGTPMMDNYTICRIKYSFKNDAISSYGKYKNNSLGTVSVILREKLLMFLNRTDCSFICWCSVNILLFIYSIAELLSPLFILYSKIQPSFSLVLKNICMGCFTG